MDLTIFPFLLLNKKALAETSRLSPFLRSLKTELIYGNKLISKEQMKLEVFEYIEICYNRKRRNSALNYATIEEFNNQINYKNVA